MKHKNIFYTLMLMTGISVSSCNDFLDKLPRQPYGTGYGTEDCKAACLGLSARNGQCPIRTL